MPALSNARASQQKGLGEVITLAGKEVRKVFMGIVGLCSL
jgi:hypothetical protein